MRTKILLFCAALLTMAAGPASATLWDTVDLTADCEGWAVNGSVHFGPVRTEADVDYVVNLREDGVVIATFSGVQTVYAANPVFAANGLWGLELCGDYTVDGRVHLQTPDNDARTFNAALTCDCPDEDACHYTPGYWKNHVEAWPVTSLTLGGVTYSQAQLLEIMGTPVGGDATIILAYHLIAAKLNVLSGASSSIDGAIADADAYLMAHPLFSKPAKAAKTAGEAIKNALASYNEMGCPDGFSDESTFSKSLGFESAEQEVTSWGALKGTYR